jgi:Uma2 family endonuclease
MVEVSETTLKQDEGKKLLAYQDAGIPEYWIVDVAAKVVRIHRLNRAKTYSEETHSKDTITLQAFPDVTIDLGNLFWESLLNPF